MEIKIVKQASSGRGHIALIRVGREEEEAWRERDYEEARKRLAPAEVPADVVNEIQDDLLTAR